MIDTSHPGTHIIINKSHGLSVLLNHMDSVFILFLCTVTDLWKAIVMSNAESQSG